MLRREGGLAVERLDPFVDTHEEGKLSGSLGAEFDLCREGGRAVESLELLVGAHGESK